MCISDRYIDDKDKESLLVLEVLVDLKNWYCNCLGQQNDPQKEMHLLCNASQLLYKILDSPMHIARARIQSLENINHNDDDALCFEGEGLSNPLVHYLLKPAVHRFITMIDEIAYSSDETKLFQLSASLLTNKQETKVLNQVLQLFTRLTQFDITLAEELAKVGSHLYLSKIFYLDSSSIIESIYGSKESFVREDRDQLGDKESLSRQYIFEQDEDILTEIQDTACKIAYDDRLRNLSFPVKISPFTTEELRLRLPLEFKVQSPYYGDTNTHIDSHATYSVSKVMSFLIQQVTDRQSAQEDVGFVMWPSAVVLSSWLLHNPSILSKKKIVELGAGCGLAGLVASRIVTELIKTNSNYALIEDETKNFTKSHQIILTDFNNKVLKNIDRNIALNDLNHVATTMSLDFYLQTGKNHHGGWVTKLESQTMDGSECIAQSPVDVILAADVICNPSDSIAVSKTIYDVLKPGGEAIIVSANSEHRFGVDSFEAECEKVGLNVKVIDVSSLCAGKLLPQNEDSDDPCSLRKTSGFVDGMSMTMFRVFKPNI